MPEIKRSDLIFRKLANAKGYLGELEELRPKSLQEHLSNLEKKRAIERQIQLLVESVVDAGEIIVIDQSKQPPKNRKEVIIKLKELNVVSTELAQAMIPAISLRNRIVHEYDIIKDELVFAAIPKIASAAQGLITALSKFVATGSK